MDKKKIIMLSSYHNVMETGLKLEEWEIFTKKILWCDVYKSLQSFFASKNIIKHTSPRSLRFSMTMDTKVYYQTSATIGSPNQRTRFESQLGRNDRPSLRNI